MEHNWFCPFCGNPMTVHRDIANDTGRVSYSVACADPRHYATKSHASVGACEAELDETMRR
ncbi:hypothetical protein JS528_01135 [Bifidobacterium sp. MA2]|uniref:Restriction alleviation protein, Lar family n=1 Tax=Bifidobacterium santillanense TaxID=2809028 RepID=A0ABS5UM65_9BIFI|nr:hypothetical protein [Bifidobacterium santillanense]MBT1171984.1 hypothetical protein [Bifidobacterium santillanense]